MANKPFFSIIIPSLNEEIALPQLLQNLADQTNRNFEVIHIDGKSDDATCKLANRFAKKLPAFTQIISNVRHVSHQRNLGAKVAKGEYLLFIDADTGLPHYFLEGLSYQLHRKPTDLFTTWYEADSHHTQDKAVVTVINLALDISHSLDSPFAIGVFIGSTPKAFKRIGGFREDVSFGEDEDYIKVGYKLGFDFTIFHHPRIVYSLRRFRSGGTLVNLQNIAAKKLAAITGKKQLLKPKDYLMGGHLFRDDSTNKSAFLRLDNAIQKFKANPKLKKFLRNLITLEEFD